LHFRLRPANIAPIPKADRRKPMLAPIAAIMITLLVEIALYIAGRILRLF
jgi:hypothetical protein